MIELILILYVLALNALIGGIVADKRGRNIGDGLMWGMILGPLAWAWMLLRTDMRPWCPHCSTPRLPGATVCRACRREFSGT